MATNKNSNRVDFQERFEHNHKTYTIMGQNLNMGTERFVVGPLRGARPDYAAAEWGLISSAIVKLLCDGQTLWKKGDDIEKLPSEYDPETGQTTGEKVLRVLVTKRFKHLADNYEEPFGDYLDEDEEDETFSDPMERSQKPTLIGPSEPSE